MYFYSLKNWTQTPKHVFLRGILEWTLHKGCVVLSYAARCSFIWTCGPLRYSLLQVMFPQKSNKRGQIKSASVCVMESDRGVDVKVVLLSELGMCVCLAGSRCGLYRQLPTPPTCPGNCPGCRRLATPSLSPRRLFTTEPQGCCFPNQWARFAMWVFTMGAAQRGQNRRDKYSV